MHNSHKENTKEILSANDNVQYTTVSFVKVSIFLWISLVFRLSVIIKILKGFSCFIQTDCSHKVPNERLILLRKRSYCLKPHVSCLKRSYFLC